MTAENYLSIFMSYASEDFDKVHPFYSRLKKEGARVWMDKENLLPGQDWEFAIRKQIKDSDFFLVFLTNNSVTKRGFLQKEIKLALDLWDEKLPDDIFLIPIRLDDCIVPDSLAKFHRVDIFDHEEINRDNSNYTKLIEGIKYGAEKLGKILIPSNNQYQILNKAIQEISRNKYLYEIEVAYPHLENLKHNSYEDVNNILFDDINDFIIDFRKHAIDDSSRKRKLQDDYIGMRLDELWINYEIHMNDDHLLSLEYSIFTITTTAPHPNWETVTHNFTLPDCRAIKLQELFRQNSNYLEIISEFCINDLIAQTLKDNTIDLKDLIEEGAGPKIDNFSVFYFTEKDMCFVFHSNGIWPHAWVRRDVQIPYSKLAELILETSVISRFLQ